MLSQKANVDHKENTGQSAIIWAAAEGNTEVVSLLIKAGADANETMDSGFTPLLLAARDGHRATVGALLAEGVDVNYATSNQRKTERGAPRGTSALRLAVENGHFELAVDLLKAGADPNDQRSGHAALHVLTWVRKPDRGDGLSGLPGPRGSGKIDSLEFARTLITDFDGDVNLRIKNGSKGRVDLPRIGRHLSCWLQES